MEPSRDGEQTIARSVVHWRSVILIGATVAGGLALTSMVIGATPTVGGSVAAAPDAVAAVVGTDADPSTTVPVDPSTSEAVPASTDVVSDPTPIAAAVPVTGVTVVSPAGRAAPTAQTTQPAATPTATATSPVQPSADPSKRAVDPTTASPTTAAPATAAPATAAPATAAPATAAPTTAAPTVAAPTTAAPSTVAMSSPSYTVSGASTVTLQFDGSSIAVASVSPQANWVYQIEKNGPRTIEIKFYNTATGSDREFHATVENGRIKVET